MMAFTAASRMTATWLLLSTVVGLSLGLSVMPANNTDFLNADSQLQLFTTTVQSGSLTVQVQPLTARAGRINSTLPSEEFRIVGALVLTDMQTATNLTRSDIAYISCQNSSYTGQIRAEDVVSTAATRRHAAIVLYSTQAAYCTFEAAAEERASNAIIFTMTSASASAQLENELRAYGSLAPRTSISRSGGNGTSSMPPPPTTSSGSGSGNRESSFLTTSPTTAVAMIILYSITGVITALFLIIIITGAIRAHRHPERYGPRAAGNGRTRQSRAKRIARAMLDTLPIVKFGEREGEAKAATDVELGTGVQAGAQAGPSGAAGEGASPAAAAATAEGQLGEGENASATEPHRSTTPAGEDEVTAVVPKPTDTPATKDNPAEDATPSCSICTEDFVKGEDVRVLPCNHQYHPECIDPWLLNVSGTCPLCRIDLRPAVASDGSGNQSGSSNRRRQSASAVATMSGAAQRGDGEGGGADASAAAPADGSRSTRMSRFLELHLGLTAASAPEERIAALLRHRDERRGRHHHHLHPRRARGGARGVSGAAAAAGDGGSGGGGGSGDARSRSSSRPGSGLAGLIRDPFRRRSSRMTDSWIPPDDGASAGAGAAGVVSGGTGAAGTTAAASEARGSAGVTESSPTAAVDASSAGYVGGSAMSAAVHATAATTGDDDGAATGVSAVANANSSAGSRAPPPTESHARAESRGENHTS